MMPAKVTTIKQVHIQSGVDRRSAGVITAHPKAAELERLDDHGDEHEPGEHGKYAAQYLHGGPSIKVAPQSSGLIRMFL